MEIAVPEALDDVPSDELVDEAARVSTSVAVGASADEPTISAEEQPNIAKSREKPRNRGARVAVERAKTTSAEEGAHEPPTHAGLREATGPRARAPARRALAHEQTTNGRGLLGGLRDAGAPSANVKTATPITSLERYVARPRRSDHARRRFSSPQMRRAPTRVRRGGALGSRSEADDRTVSRAQPFFLPTNAAMRAIESRFSGRSSASSTLMP